MPNAVYDEEEKLQKKAGSHDDLDISDADRERETAALNDSFYRDEGPDLLSAEESGDKGDYSTQADTSERKGIFRSEKEGKTSKAAGFVKKNKLRIAIATGIMSLILTIASFLLGPLKVLNIANNLQSRYASVVEQNAESLTGRLLVTYMSKKVVPGMVDKKCNSTSVNRSCAKVEPGSGVVSTMFAAWRDQNLEKKLADKYGFEIRREGNKFFIRSDNLQRDIFVGDYDAGNQREFERKMFTTFNRSDVRRELNRAMEGETKYKRVMYRFKFGKLIERKYGAIVRCVIRCDAQNDRIDRRELRKLRYKAWFVSRIVTPRSDMYNLAIQCAMSDFDCVDNNNDEIGDDGDRQSRFERDVRTQVSTRIGNGTIDADELSRTIEDIRNSGGVTDHLLKKLVSEGFAKGVQRAANAIPIVGWIDLTARLFKAAETAGPAFRQINYTINSNTMATQYMLYRSNADEIKFGEGMDAEQIGYMVESLGDKAGKDQNGGGAEASPFYAEVMNTGVKSNNLANILFPKVSAQAPYKCDDGSTISSGLCPEMSLKAVTAFTGAAGGLSKIVENAAPVGVAADFWLSTGGRIIDLIGNFLGDALVPVVEALVPQFIKDQAAQIITAIGKWFISKAINDPVGNDPSGARNFELAAGGADVVYNDQAHYGFGGKKLSDQTVSAIRDQRKTEAINEFKQQSFLARTFSTNNSFSLVSRIANAMPGTSGRGLLSGAMSVAANPFGSLKLNTATASAASTEDPFGVTQYGYEQDDPIFNIDDYEKYWDDNKCDDDQTLTSWAESAQDDPDTGQPVHTTTNGCAFLRSIATSNCGYFTDECLTPDELGETVLNTTATGIKLRVATFNIYHSDDPIWRERLSRSVSVIKDNDLDIVGMQEVRPDQMEELLKPELISSTYEMWPNALKNPEYNPNPIIWKPTKYRALSKDYINVRYFKGAAQRIPVILFEDIATGQKFYFANTHDPASGGDRGDNDAIRDDNARIYREYFEKIRSSDKETPFMLVGDFNSSVRGETAPIGQRTSCILTKTIFWNAYHAAKNDASNCPSKGPSGVDHIYLSRNVSASKYYIIDKGKQTGNGSDHNTVIADVAIGSTNAGTDFVMGTYNQPARGNAAAAASRIVSSKMDVVGLQEQSGDNYNVMKGILKDRGYAVFPDVNMNGGGHCARARPIYFSTNKFNLVKSDFFDIPSYENNAAGPVAAYRNPVDCGNGERTKGGGRANIPIVWLNDIKTGQTIIVMNTHNLANCCGGGGEQASKKRYDAAQIYIAKIKELNATNPGTPVFFSGDFNEGTGVRSQRGTNTTWQRDHNNLFYCMATKQERIMVRAAGSSEQPCTGDNEGIGGVDYIYASPNVKTEWVNQFRDPSTNDSPHDVVYARLVVPAANANDSGTKGVAGWSWPLKSNINNGPCYGGPRVHAGMDMNSSTDSNVVYAMHSGKVVRKGYDSAAGNYITILADENFNGKPVYYSYEHLKIGSIKFSVNDLVKGGEPVAIAGLTGNVSVQSSRAHLHIVTATTNTLGSYGNLGTTFDPMKILGSVTPIPGGYKCYVG